MSTPLNGAAVCVCVCVCVFARVRVQVLDRNTVKLVAQEFDVLVVDKDAEDVSHRGVSHVSLVMGESPKLVMRMQ